MSTQPKLLDRVRDRLRYKQYTLRTEQAYIVRFAFDSCSIFLGVLGVLAV
jgi:hypothetical protein